MRRGELLTIAVGGDYGKPRPALLVQADPLALLPSVTMLRLTNEIVSEHLLRATALPTSESGPRLPSQVMIDKAVTVPRDRVGVRSIS